MGGKWISEEKDDLGKSMNVIIPANLTYTLMHTPLKRLKLNLTFNEVLLFI